MDVRYLRRVVCAGLLALILGGCTLIDSLYDVHIVFSDGFTIKWSEDGDLWKEARGAKDVSVMHIDHGGGYFVGVDEAGGTWFSENGISWEQGESVGGGARGIAVDDSGRCVIVGYGIWFSENGRDWQHITDLPIAADLWDVCFGNGIFLAVGDGSLRSDNGTDWAETFTGNWRVTYGQDDGTGQGRFLSCGQNGAMAYSDDNGQTWTNSGDIPGYMEISALGYGSGRFVAVGSNASVYYSDDGIEWLLSALPGQEPMCNDLIFGFDQRFYAIGDSGMWRSTDGVEWERVGDSESERGFAMASTD